jgi:hypothetical protein
MKPYLVTVVPAQADWYLLEPIIEEKGRIRELHEILIIAWRIDSYQGDGGSRFDCTTAICQEDYGKHYATRHNCITMFPGGPIFSSQDEKLIIREFERIVRKQKKKDAA